MGCISLKSWNHTLALSVKGGIDTGLILDPNYWTKLLLK